MSKTSRSDRPRARGRSRRSRGEPEPTNDGHLVPGERAVCEILEAAPRRVVRVVVDDRRSWANVRQLAERSGVALEVVSGDVLRQRFGHVDTRGVVALARPIDFRPLDELLEATVATPGGLLVALDEVEDPQNLGAIMRSCEFFGAKGLVWTRDRAAAVTPSVVRASAGASERLALCQVTNLATALQSCRDAGLWSVGTVVDGGDSLAELVSQDRLPEHLVLVMGSEGRGLRRLTRERCDFLATIDRAGAVGSLNVSAAAAVVLALVAARKTDRSDD